MATKTTLQEASIQHRLVRLSAALETRRGGL